MQRRLPYVVATFGEVGSMQPEKALSFVPAP